MGAATFVSGPAANLRTAIKYPSDFKNLRRFRTTDLYNIPYIVQRSVVRTFSKPKSLMEKWTITGKNPKKETNTKRWINKIIYGTS